MWELGFLPFSLNLSPKWPQGRDDPESVKGFGSRRDLGKGRSQANKPLLNLFLKTLQSTSYVQAGKVPSHQEQSAIWMDEYAVLKGLLP